MIADEIAGQMDRLPLLVPSIKRFADIEVVFADEAFAVTVDDDGVRFGLEGHGQAVRTALVTVGRQG